MLYTQPATLDEVVTALAADEGAKCLAGGATLVAMLNAGLLQPTQIISLQNVAELRGITVEPTGAVRIGAMVSHAAVEAEARLVAGLALVRQAASQIAHPPIRNMGTIGGSLAHADPNADYPCALTAAGAEVEIAGPAGRRTCAIDAFFLDYLATVLEPGEVVVAVRLPASLPEEASVYLKFARVDGDYATVSVAVRLSWSNDACATIRIAFGSCGPVPLRIASVEQSLAGTRLDAETLRRAAQAYADAADPVDDFRGTGEYRRMLIPGLLERAVRAALDERRGVAS